MTDIIQIFKSVGFIEKPDYNATSRQSIGNWESITSKTGFFKDGTITLPIESKNNLTIKDADLIIIQDINGFDPIVAENFLVNTPYPDWFKNSRKEDLLSDNLQLKGFTILSKPWTFEIFDLKKMIDESIEIWLNFPFTFGIPRRENHKIAELKKGKSIRYKINEKSDFTMTGRRQRTFYEFDYIIEYIGTADKIEYVELNRIETIKTIPASGYKLIDERKILT